ncbi:MAG: hypothetical protein PHT94_04440 [Candidatus Nanoarchaeia archaeon]|nr:hypothetical protein [Candidatus Nanoarchaeia archaeon]
MKIIIKSSKDVFNYSQYKNTDKGFFFSDGKNSVSLIFDSYKEKDKFEKEIDCICCKGIVNIEKEMIQFKEKMKFFKVPVEIDYKVSDVVLYQTFIDIETSFGKCKINW